MKASELLKVLEGVPDEALPADCRGVLAAVDVEERHFELPMQERHIHAAVGAMVAWLGITKEAQPEIRSNAPVGVSVEIYNDATDTVEDHGGATLIEALAAACRAVSGSKA